MDLNYTEEQTLLRDSAERFLGQKYDFVRRQQIVASEDGFSPEIWSEFAELGWLALPLPEAMGGLGGSTVDLALLMESFGRALVVEPYVPTIVLGAGLVAAQGDDAQQQDILPAVAEGALRLAFAHSEPGRPYSVGTVGTAARRQGAGWVLEGRKSMVLGGGGADRLIVSARIAGAPQDALGIGLFVVPQDTPGLSVSPHLLVDGTRAADVALDGVALPSEALLGGSEDALPAIEAALDRAIVAASADALGVLDKLLDATVEYSKTRVQFRQPIGKFQALQHRMAEMAVLREEARAILLYATIAADGTPAERARGASAAKAKIGTAVRKIAEESIQMHGAMGVTEELNIGAYAKRALAYEYSFGSTAYHLRRYAGFARDPGFIGRSLIE